MSAKHRNTYAAKLTARQVWAIRQRADSLPSDWPGTTKAKRILAEMPDLKVSVTTVWDVLMGRSFVEDIV